jgi:dihydrofolate reductase
MRKVIVAAFISMDGVMQAPGGPEEDPTGGFRYGGWVWPLGDETFGEEIGKLFGQPYDLLLGRKTYEIFAAYWPYQDEDGPNADITKSFNAITKYVASRKGVDLTWKNSVALRDAAADVARVRKENGPALVTQGSGDLIQTLLANDLVDEIRTFTFPILLGKGKWLFSDRSRPAAFKLSSNKMSPNGIVIASYERAGDVQTGTFETKPPSQAELARREKWKREG